MAIKRFTIELDDSSDLKGTTSLPETVRVTETEEFKSRELTRAPYEKESQETESLASRNNPPKAPGRTISDLFAEFINNPRVMSTLLIFLPFPFFAARIDDIADLMFPLVVGIILNFVWFGIPWINSSTKNRAK